MQKNKESCLIWFRNDLRVCDNAALSNAKAKNDSAVAVYCYDPRQFQTDAFGFKKTEVYRAQFLIETISNLKQELEKLNIPLFIFHEKPEVVIPDLVSKYEITSLYYQKEWTDEEYRVEQNLKHELPDTLQLNSYYDQFLYHPEDLNFEIDKLPNVFTVFRKKIEKYIAVRAQLNKPKPFTRQADIENTTRNITLSQLGFTPIKKEPNNAFPFKGGENEAMNRINDYFFQTKKLGFYKKTRNGLIGTDFSSKLSPWLANGSISARQIYWAVKKFENFEYKNESTYWLIFELIWRDYFKYISLKYKSDIFKISGILNKEYDWKVNTKEINKWINGETNEPFVNANMIELKKTGWMSNRGRQNVASYFSKSLKLDWRIGAAYFESLLIDYDVHSNYGNWMYVAGVGNDPRDRTFNVSLQAKRYDPNGKYQRLWLQETLF